MRQLRIDSSELEIAFDYNGGMISAYLDRETGEIISINNDDHYLFIHIYETYYDENTTSIDLVLAFQEEQFSDWQLAVLLDSDRIQGDYRGRFISSPSQGSSEGYRDMIASIEMVREPRLQERLERAISGRDSLRYFKDVLPDYPSERECCF